MKDGKLNRNKISLSVIFFIIAITFCSCMQEVSYEKKGSITQTIENFVVTETKDGQIKTVLYSDIAIIKESEQVAFLTEPTIKFYDNGKYSATLIARTGQIKLDTNNIKAIGPCNLTTAQGEIVETSDVDYDHLKELVYSDSDIKITRGKDVVYGKGFESDTKLNNIVIKNERIVID